MLLTKTKLAYPYLKLIDEKIPSLHGTPPND